MKTDFYIDWAVWGLGVNVSDIPGTWLDIGPIHFSIRRRTVLDDD